MVRRLSCSELSLRDFAKQENVAFSTLYSWQVKYPVAGSELTAQGIPDKWSCEEKFGVVLETAILSENELGEYCRNKGLYPEQVQLWKLSCIQGNMTKKKQNQISEQSKADKKRIKELERELRRKDKALAETAALLVLRKKLNALWDENEDD